jgi:hypothetical protein
MEAGSAVVNVTRELHPVVTRLFAPSMGVLFLVGKLVIRRVARRLAAVSFDMADAVAWFGVDISALSLTLWIGLRLHSRAHLGYEETVAAYVVLTLIVIVAACCYRAHLYTVRNPAFRAFRRLAKMWWTFAGLSLGFSCFVATVGLL